MSSIKINGTFNSLTSYWIPNFHVSNLNTVKQKTLQQWSSYAQTTPERTFLGQPKENQRYSTQLMHLCQHGENIPHQKTQYLDTNLNLLQTVSTLRNEVSIPATTSGASLVGKQRWTFLPSFILEWVCQWFRNRTTWHNHAGVSTFQKCNYT